MAETKNTYYLAVPESAITLIVRDSASHQGAYQGSIDFAVPVDTPVVAAADGLVTRVRDDSDQYGQERSFGPLVNYITIEHGDKELSEYLHLAKGSALVKPGDNVTVGQQIASTGLSGWLYAPHLHFMVYPKSNGKLQCLEVRFKWPLPGRF